MPGFTLDLTEDQLTLQKWLHEFAADVVRPAAAEWDEREETPWPVIQEAARAGHLLAWTSSPGPRGRDRPVAADRHGGAVLGRRRHRPVDRRHDARPPRAWSPTARSSRSWSGRRRCSARETDVRLGALAVSEPGAGSDVSAHADHAPCYDEKTDEWVLNGVKTWITNGGIADVHVVVAAVDPALGPRPGVVRRRPGVQGPRPVAGPEVQEARHPRLATPPRSCSTTCRVPGRLPARRQGQARRAAGPRPRARAAPARRAAASSGATQARRPRWRPSRRPAPASARRPSASPGRPTSTRWTTPGPASSSAGRSSQNQGIAFLLADMKTRLDAARLLVWRAAWMGRNGRPFTNGEGSMSKLFAGRGRRRHHREGDPGPRRQRLHPRVPGGALAPRREDLHDLRGHQRDPAADHQPGDLRAPDPRERG